MTWANADPSFGHPLIVVTLGRFVRKFSSIVTLNSSNGEYTRACLYLRMIDEKDRPSRSESKYFSAGRAYARVSYVIEIREREHTS